MAHLRGGRTGTAAVVEAMQDALALVAAWVGEAGVHAQLNLLACDGDALVATRAAAGRAPHDAAREPPSLYTLSRASGDACIASEPFDARREWSRVPPGKLVVVDRRSALTHVPLAQGCSIAS